MSSVYTLIPRPIGSFAGLDMASRYAFGLIFDRWRLSARDGNGKYKDEHGVYCVFSREAMAAEMGISVPTLRVAMKELIRREVIHSRMANVGGAWRYYIPARVIEELRADRKQEQPQRKGEPMLRHSEKERHKTVAAAILDFDDL